MVSKKAKLSEDWPIILDLSENKVICSSNEFNIDLDVGSVVCECSAFQSLEIVEYTLFYSRNYT